MTTDNDVYQECTEAFQLGQELGQRTLDEIARAIRHEINVRECCRRPADEIEALRWCLELVED